MAGQVLLLHGVLNPRWWMAPLAGQLRRQGFDAHTFGYYGALAGPDAAVEALRRRLRHADAPVALVGHSLGGLVALEALRREPGLPVDRVVCLGSPLRGSRVACAVAGAQWCGWALGRSAPLLMRGLDAWSGGAAVGMVAGSVPRGIGRLFAEPGGPSDGTVALEETRLDGLADHCVVPASHSGLAFSPQAARQTLAFLRHGRFQAG